jgi:hypothetical protein
MPISRTLLIDGEKPRTDLTGGALTRQSHPLNHSLHLPNLGKLIQLHHPLSDRPYLIRSLLLQACGSARK